MSHRSGFTCKDAIVDGQRLRTWELQLNWSVQLTDYGEEEDDDDDDYGTL